MARRIVWSPEAIEDIESIARYISRDSEWYAQAVTSKFIALAGSLASLAERGRVAPEIQDPAILERFAYSYRLIYRIEVDRVTIAAVLHGKRLLEPDIAGISGGAES